MRTKTNIAEKSFDELVEICEKYSTMIEMTTKQSLTSVAHMLTSFEKIGGET